MVISVDLQISKVSDMTWRSTWMTKLSQSSILVLLITAHAIVYGACLTNLDTKGPSSDMVLPVRTIPEEDRLGRGIRIPDIPSLVLLVRLYFQSALDRAL
jgi:hypothetical protein